MADPTTNNNAIITGQIPSNDLWPSFGIPSFELDEVRITCETLGGLAEAVLDEYGIDSSDEAGVGAGGELANLDIKRMDAMTVLNMSLIEAGADINGFVEPIVNPNGEVEFREIGGYNGEIEDIYYEILTGSYTESPRAVMVTAGRPLPTIKELKWYPIWGESPVRIYTTKDMFLNCRKQDFSRHATIVFNDPQLTTAYEDGIDNLYNIGTDNPWDRIVGYAKYINPGPLATKDTVINYTNTAQVPLQIGTENAGADGPNMGTLVDKPKFDDIYSSQCWADVKEDVDFTDGVKVIIPDELRYTTVREVFKDKLLKVANVYLIGREIQTRSIAPRTQADAKDVPTTENAKLIVSIENPDTTTIKLEAGKHYAVAYEDVEGTDVGKTPYVVFTKEVMEGDPFDYGKDQTYHVDTTCKFAKDNSIVSIDQEYVGTIFPHARYKGVLVQDIWVEVELETPSITIYDPAVPEGDSIDANAAKIAIDLEYYVAPIVMVEPPNPIAYAGPGTSNKAELVEQEPSTDNDPTTVQDFEDRDIEQYMDEMQGSGMSITWSHLDEDNVEAMCDVLFQHFQSKVVETIYTCGPDCNPILGGYGERDGVVNAIRHNYTDSGSYTVSVTEGPTLVGNLTPVDGGATAKMADNQSAGGTIVDMAGDNIHFKVRIDGYGERWAVNMMHSVLRKGDVVSCTIHNNPMEA
jgi:hypothetical protein